MKYFLQNFQKNNKLFLSLCQNILTFALIPLVIIFFYYYKSAETTISNHIFYSLKENALHQGELISRKLSHTILNVQSWSQLEVMENVKNNSINLSLLNLIKNFKNTYPEFDFIDCIRKDGIVVASTRYKKNLSPKKHIKLQKIPQETEFVKIKNLLFLQILFPILLKENFGKKQKKKLGYLVGYYNIHKILEKVAAEEEFVTMKVAFCQEEIGKKSLKKLPSEYGEIMSKSGDVILYHKKFFISSAPVKLENPILQKKLFVLLFHEKEIAFAELNKVTRTNLFLTGIFILLMLFFAIFIAKKFTSPIHQMSELVQEVPEKQNFKKRLYLNRNDELGDLASRFDSMCDSMEKYQFVQKQQRSFLEKLILLYSKANPDDILELGFHECIDETLAGKGVLYILDSKKKMAPLQTYGLDSEEETKEVFSYIQGMVQRVVNMKKILLFTYSPDLYEKKNSQYSFQSKYPYLVFVPILHEGKVQGVIFLGSLTPFDKHKSGICQMLSGQIKIGYDNVLKANILRQRTREIERQHKEILEQKQSLEKINLELKKVNQYKSDFLSHMSHELRTPLNSMIGYTSLTLKKAKNQLTPLDYNNLKHAEQSARFLLNLINGILDFSKIEAGKMEIFLETFDLAKTIRECLVRAQGLISTSKVKIISNLQSSLPLIESDSMKIEQILNNLLSNAVKFTKEGEILIKATINPLKNIVLLKVKDSGCGMEEKNLGTVFESFRQLDGSLRKTWEGTGLGLTITKSLCEILGIRIHISSQLGKGTSVELTIPFQFSEKLIQESCIQKVPLISSPSILPLRNPPLKNDSFKESSGKILIVDDNLVNLALTEQIFEEEGYTVFSASSGEEAIKLSKKEHPLAILIDLSMPEMDGFQTTKKLKEDPLTSSIILIACSAFTNPEYREKAFQVGCEGYITKPIEPNYLIEQVKEYILLSKGNG